MFVVIVNKLRYKKKCYLVVLFEINISSKILFYNIVLTFSLVINLKMKSREQIFNNVQTIAQR